MTTWIYFMGFRCISPYTYLFINFSVHVDSKGFWRWCITLRNPGYLYSCSYTDIGCLSNWPNRISVSHPHPWGWKHPLSETLCSLEYRTVDEAQKPINPESAVHIYTNSSLYNSLCYTAFIKWLFLWQGFQNAPLDPDIWKPRDKMAESGYDFV
jgi:hypothetical protein